MLLNLLEIKNKMAVMSARKQALGNLWKTKNKQREKQTEQEDKPEEKISEEEHKKRIQMLKDIGLLK